MLFEQKVLFKGAMALYYMNKPGGFKCPSCAWPDPAPGHTDPLVFCENGAKALAFEATAKRVTPEFLLSIQYPNLLNSQTTGLNSKVALPTRWYTTPRVTIMYLLTGKTHLH